MKPVREWDENYVLNHIPPGEHDWVEFKGRRGLDLTLAPVNEGKVLDNLAVQLSAFANTGGGTIVYGIKDAKAGAAREVEDGGVAINIKGDTKEWLEDVIPNRVEYELTDFNVYVVTKDHGGQTIQNGRGVFLVEVGDSEAAPHQSRWNKCYYARVGGKSRPIGHRLVMDIAGRLKHPRVQPEFSFYKSGGQLRLDIILNNCGKVYAQFINCLVSVPSPLFRDPGKESHGVVEEAKLEWVSNVHEDLVGQLHGSFPLKISRYEPLLPGVLRRTRTDFWLNESAVAALPKSKIKWRVHADSAPPVDGEIAVGDISCESAK